MSVTIKQVAARSGMSLMTVSYILNGTRGRTFRAETRDRVLAAAAELGYRRNSAAKAISTGRFGSVALVQSNKPFHGYLPDSLLGGIHDALALRDLSLTLARLPDEKLTDEAFVPKVLREWTSDGLLIDYITDIPQRLADLIDRHQIPAIWINARRAADCVFPDDLRAGYDATRRLIEMGHRRIAYLNYTRGYVTRSRHYSEADRAAGYEKAMLESGLAAESICLDGVSLGRDDIEISEQWLRRPDRPTAVLTYSMREPAAVLVAARSCGLRVPHDLSLIAFSAEPTANAWGVACSAMLVPQATVADRAVEQLAQRIQVPAKSIEPVAVPLCWVEGTTVAPPPIEAA
ncbi:MAG TPA: LacI family DNA-binding transcriptional regulator [Tepidisphaeraceae bacterium]|jgi:LacI family transcriptional regulator|nr:LacI family DNA-binding transcriptional regulator [Tepidisphaeraceae bacterium]